MCLCRLLGLVSWDYYFKVINPQLQREFEASLGYVNTCLINKTKQNIKNKVLYSIQKIASTDLCILTVLYPTHMFCSPLYRDLVNKTYSALSILRYTVSWVSQRQVPLCLLLSHGCAWVQEVLAVHPHCPADCCENQCLPSSSITPKPLSSDSH